MTEYLTFRTDIWTLSLPIDWAQRASGDGKSLYFESSDGSKGIYIATWNLGPDEHRAAEEIAASFKESDLNSLATMNGYDWKIVTEASHGSGQACLVMTDCLAEEKHYRMVGRILIASPIMVRASFHDYACGDYDVSRAYYAPIIDSLQFFLEPV